eukprot:CAMPEP_0180821582 /NCGR_PEP_ID=MMETSP1038_2-20121128/70904_1 /TAXON_ID=632150 /ORGANISM="Azadinium spinosum, Strain 3D9" /LENGTH=39 /DNA_ID= /DNA_START= /DNA_END= /DNA_ORIENTATION=
MMELNRLYVHSSETKRKLTRFLQTSDLPAPFVKQIIRFA